MHEYLGLMQDVFAVALVFVFPLIDLPAMQHLKRFSSTAARLALYRRSVLATSVFVIIALAIAPLDTLLIIARSHTDAPWLDRHSVISMAASALIALLFAWVLWPSIQCVFRKRIRKAYLEAYLASLVRFMLPVSRQERRWWVLLSLSGGIGEELLYRGFLLQYFRGQLIGGPGTGLIWAWVLSSLAFGLGHVYQGKRGVLETTTAGAVFGMLAILSGGLALPILMHILIDLRILLVYNPAQDDPQRAAPLISGFNPQVR
ncbi:CPBP family intramembrane glutamic endopeptidase [Dyella mobilis]|nr:CPBP family intramembrane glutamic endopeptidase [Dyella mobilis]